ncbi:MAG: hypothetical protein R3E66_14755 [bacterium]
MLRPTPLIALTFLSAFAASTASAHSGEALAEAITLIDDAVLVKTNFGVVASHFDGFVCEEAFLGGEIFHVAALGKDQWVTLSENGIWTTDDGCEFTKVAELTVAPTDVATELTTKSVAYALNSMESGGIWLSQDQGQSWTRVLENDSYQWTGVRFAPAGRLVATAYDRDNMGAAHLVTYDVTSQVSNDAPIAEVTYPYLLDALDDDILWLGRTDTQTAFWGTIDQPKLRPKMITSWPTAARILSPTKVVLAGLFQQRGLSEGTLTGDEVVWNDLAPITTAVCVTPDGDSYLVCSQARFDMADVIRVTGPDLAPEFDFKQLEGPRACPAGSSVAEVCPVVWRELQRSLGLVPTEEPMPDAGMPDADMTPDDVGVVTPPSANDPDGCSAVGTSPALLSLLGILWMRRKRT